MRKFSGPLARRYGTALYESILESSPKESSFSFEQKVEIIRELSAVFDKSIIAFFVSPILLKKEKNELIALLLEKVFGKESNIPSEIPNFLKLVVENDRFEELPSILKYFLNKVDEHLGIVRTTLVAANELSEPVVNSFSTALESTLKRKVVLDVKTDHSLRAGFLVKIGNTTIDVSLRSQLANLKESLNY